MHIETSTFPGGNVMLHEVCEDCSKCGKEMMDIVFLGEVCPYCDPMVIQMMHYPLAKQHEN